MKFVCVKCGSDQIITNVALLDKEHANTGFAKIAIDEEPNAWFDKKRTTSEITARVCANCGFIELYAVNLDALKKAHTSIVDKFNTMRKKIQED